MTKSRASLKGRGVDILLGGSAEPEETAAPVTGNQPAPATPAPDPFAGEAPAEADVNPFAEPAPATSFAEGAGTAFDVNPFAEPSAQPGVESSGEPMTEPAAESAFESEIVSSQPSAPVATSLPPEETPWLTDESLAIPQAGAAETSFADSGPVSVALPNDPTLSKSISIGGLFMDMPSIPNPESFEPPTELTQTGLRVQDVSQTRQTASEDEVLRRITTERIATLSKRIDTLYSELARGTISDTAQVSDALIYLRRARDKELENQRQYDEAEYLVNVANYLITRSTLVQQWSGSWGVIIFFYALAWLALFLTGLILDRTGGVISLFRAMLPSDLATATSMTALFPPYTTVLWGGVGGVLGVLYSLFKHIAVRHDFDRQFVIWYFIQPFMGVLMGAIVHLLFVSGVFTIVSATGEEWQSLGALLAIAFAFRQHYMYAWLESVLKAFDPGKGGKVEEQKSETTLTTRTTETSTGPTSPEETPASLGSAGVG